MPGTLSDIEGGSGMEEIAKILCKLVEQVGERQDILLNVIMYEDHYEAYVLPLYGDDPEGEDECV